MLKGYRTALYLRLSRDDDRIGESGSISAQRSMLRRYAEENHCSVLEEYVDDGWSGTNFDRPAFCRMIDDIEAGKIDLVLTKDLSRLGRDHIMTGQYAEIYFPQKGVRYIAVNDGYDSESQDTDIAPFRNVINEMYARDTSRKIKSALRAHMQEGNYVAAFAPYGYRKDPSDRHRLIPDAEAAAVVQRIFRSAAEGISPAEIANRLNSAGILSPAGYRQRSQDASGGGWSAAAVSRILKNPVYLGHTVQGKSTKPSFKSRVCRKKPKEEWICVRNTHEALIGTETFALAEQCFGKRNNPRTKGFCNQFAGLVFCADCGHSMSAAGTRRKDSPANLVCGNYKLHGSNSCSNHFLDYNALCKLVRIALRSEFSALRESEEALLDRAEQAVSSPASDLQCSETTSLQNRSRQLNFIIGKLYEDHAAGLLGEERMRALLQKYESEAAQLEQKLILAETAAVRSPQQQPLRETLKTHLRALWESEELTQGFLLRFIQRIEVFQGHYEQENGKRIKRQKVRIFFRFRTEGSLREITL